MQTQAFTLLEPVQRSSSVVFASPHSGCDYPEDFVRASMLNAQSIRSSEDAFVDRLFTCAVEFGSPFLQARAPRAFIDLNRGEQELDPALIEGVRRAAHNPRVASGLGVIPRVVANGQAIYQGKMPLAEANRRIASYWRPYHAALSDLLDETRAQFGEAILIDCHSMPHEAMDSIVRKRGQRPQIVLGDRFGSAAAPAVVDKIETAFTEAGLVVSRNTPFAGAYITQHYGRPSRHQHAIQIEIDRALYMDEKRIELRPDFNEFQERLSSIIARIVAFGTPCDRLAAE
ncbi:N-formylglutamate amidohydrolase [Salinihabitans flavidus]|uniref:N-formylglutamate amidohydrolase n=1 Tax=Salinihabitans flavidus TaxID=569882 RepID=A0A1H8T2Y6_9RHOB|nr:N-formylglutamate amidohydrolase [Salinihabitans flavidus]SEO84964.1 N-formylglutamate amidohydrolase [Salinihabitans flavidus]